MNKIGLFAGGEISSFQTSFDVMIGVDRGALFLAERGLPLSVAIGDFDSVSTLERQQIVAVAQKMLFAPSEKEDTDLELAVKWVFSHFPDATLTIYGALGGRLDHTFASVFLPSHPAIAPFMEQIYITDPHNLLTYKMAGTSSISPLPDYPYVAFVPSHEQAKLTIHGAKYELCNQQAFTKKLYTSNEFLDGKTISLHLSTGYVIIIYSKDTI